RVVGGRPQPAVELGVDQRARVVEEAEQGGWCARRREGRLVAGHYRSCEGRPAGPAGSDPTPPGDDSLRSSNGATSTPPEALSKISTRFSALASSCWPRRASWTPCS